LAPDLLAKQLLITISGPAGSGKSHCAEAMAKYFGIPHYSAGSIFRSYAAEKGLSIEALAKLAENDPEIDRTIDSRTEELAKTGGVILEGRLVAFFSSSYSSSLPRISFYLAAPFEERVKRIAEREEITINEATAKTVAREGSERRRYKNIYGLNLDDLSKYDFVINTQIWGKEGIVTLLTSIVQMYLSLGTKT
jgi:cytidylate kinase